MLAVVFISDFKSAVNYFAFWDKKKQKLDFEIAPYLIPFSLLHWSQKHKYHLCSHLGSACSESLNWKFTRKYFFFINFENPLYNPLYNLVENDVPEQAFPRWLQRCICTCTCPGGSCLFTFFILFGPGVVLPLSGPYQCPSSKGQRQKPKQTNNTYDPLSL